MIFSDVYIVVPAYNEEEVILDVVRKLFRYFDHLIVVNDGSQDGTGDVLKNSDVTLLTHLVNLGQGAALQTGITYALSRGAEFIVTFDSDGQHEVSDAMEMVKVIKEGSFDVVLGSRFLGSAVNIPATRKVMLKFAIWFGNLGRTTKLTDAHNGLRVLNRKAAQALDITQDGMAHASEMIGQLMNASLRICEYPVTIAYTDHSLEKGQSSLNSINIVLDLIIGRLFK